MLPGRRQEHGPPSGRRREPRPLARVDVFQGDAEGRPGGQPRVEHGDGKVVGNPTVAEPVGLEPRRGDERDRRRPLGPGTGEILCRGPHAVLDRVEPDGAEQHREAEAEPHRHHDRESAARGQEVIAGWQLDRAEWIRVSGPDQVAHHVRREQPIHVGFLEDQIPLRARKEARLRLAQVGRHHLERDRPQLAVLPGDLVLEVPDGQRVRALRQAGELLYPVVQPVRELPAAFAGLAAGPDAAPTEPEVARVLVGQRLVGDRQRREAAGNAEDTRKEGAGQQPRQGRRTAEQQGAEDRPQRQARHHPHHGLIGGVLQERPGDARAPSQGRAHARGEATPRPRGHARRRLPRRVRVPGDLGGLRCPLARLRRPHARSARVAVVMSLEREERLVQRPGLRRGPEEPLQELPAQELALPSVEPDEAGVVELALAAVLRRRGRARGNRARRGAANPPEPIPGGQREDRRRIDDAAGDTPLHDEVALLRRVQIVLAAPEDGGAALRERIRQGLATPDVGRAALRAALRRLCFLRHAPSV